MPRLRDREGKIRLTPAILPPCLWRTKSLE
jgi:hypothetical protein